jgi:hypothetical protein
MGLPPKVKRTVRLDPRVVSHLEFEAGWRKESVSSVVNKALIGRLIYGWALLAIFAVAVLAIGIKIGIDIEASKHVLG